MICFCRFTMDKKFFLFMLLEWSSVCVAFLISLWIWYFGQVPGVLQLDVMAQVYAVFHFSTILSVAGSRSKHLKSLLHVLEIYFLHFHYINLKSLFYRYRHT
jgi:hypothetical protein